MKSAEELRRIAAEAQEQARKERETAEEAARREREIENARVLNELTPRLVSELENTIECEAAKGHTSLLVVPHTLPSWMENKYNDECYFAVLALAREKLLEMEPELDIDMSADTGMEWGSDGGYSDGIRHVKVEISWGAHE